MEQQQLFNGQYFEHHPEKVLGTLSTHSRTGKVITDAYGNPRPEVRGSLKDALKRIEGPSILRQQHQPSSVILKDYSLIAKVIRKTKGQRRNTVNDQKCSDDLQCLDDTIKRYNPNMSDDEITVWITIQSKRGIYDKATIQSNAWNKYYVDEPDYQDWLDKGLVYVDEKGYSPANEFFSGDLYTKSERFEHFAPLIPHGEAYHKKTLAKLKAAIPQKLVITERADHKLILNPFDQFCQDFLITYASNEVSLVDAFKYDYLKSLSPSDFKDGTFSSSRGQIVYYWLGSSRFPNGTSKFEKATIKRNAQHIGRILFDRFLIQELSDADKQRLENVWNRKYNNYVDLDVSKIPVGFQINQKFKGGTLELRPAQHEGVSFLNKSGNGIIAYDVGVGKTMTAICTVSDGFLKGMFKRPLIVVPNPTYHKWIAEIRGVYKTGEKDVISEGILPQYTINDFYNLGVNHIDQALKKEITDHSITMLTFEGLMKLGFNAETEQELITDMVDILAQADGSVRDGEIEAEAIVRHIDRALKGAKLMIEDYGFDAIIVDEAHNFKNLFDGVKGETDERGNRGKNPYLLSGSMSNRAIKLFSVCRYIQLKNNFRNTYGLTATPFTNSPLEIYSILSLFNYKGLKEHGIANIKQFFDKFINIIDEPSWTAKGTFEIKPTIRGFNNLPLLQDIIFKTISYKTGEEAKINRPIKVTLPLKRDHDGKELEDAYRAGTELPPSDFQDYWFNQIAQFAKNGQGALDALYPSHNDPEKNGRVMYAISQGRNATFSPYMVRSESIDDEQLFIESSPKLKYVMNCIASVKAYHDSRGEQPSGQVIYANAGVAYFPLIKEYLVSTIGYQEKQVAIIEGSTGSSKKEKIKKGFLDGTIQVLIGSASIREGIDLQKRATVLYNCFLDWNPTDLKQLDGRIWRFGNIFSHVRIVIPLVENSLDVFMWQKLSEKTDRLNSIWQRQGSSTVLELDQLKPEELKYGLITDPKELVKVEIRDTEQRLTQEKTVVEGYIQQITDALQSIEQVNREIVLFEKLTEKALLRSSYYSDKDYQAILAISFTYVDQDAVYRLLDKYGSLKKDYQLKMRISRHKQDVKKLGSLERNILSKFDVKLGDNLSPIVVDFQQQVDAIQAQIDNVKTDAHLQKRYAEIVQEQQAKNLSSKTLEQRVEEFKRLNFLLECKANTGNRCDIFGIKRGKKPKQAAVKLNVEQNDKTLNVIPKQQVEPSKKSIKQQLYEAISGFQSARKYADATAKKQINQAIKGLNAAAKYAA